MRALDWIKLAVTYFVPFCVAAYGVATYATRHGNEREAKEPGKHPAIALYDLLSAVSQPSRMIRRALPSNCGRLPGATTSTSGVILTLYVTASTNFFTAAFRRSPETSDDAGSTLIPSLFPDP